MAQMGLSQDYLNEIIPFDHLPPFTNPNATEIVQVGDEFLIPTIYSGVTSTVLRIRGQDYSYVDIDSFDFASNSLHEISDGILGFAKDREQQKALRLAKFDSSFNELWKKEVITEGDFNFAQSSLKLDNYIYVMYSFDIANDIFLGISKYDLEGNHSWTKCYTKDHVLNTTGRIRFTRSGDILITASYLDRPIHRYGLVTCIDTSGNVKWTTDTLPDNERGSNLYPIELSNGRILTSQRRDLVQVDSVRLCCYPTPPSLIWLDENGNFLKETIYLIPKPSSITLNGVVAGKGDYFFTHGTYEDFPAGTGTINYYGYITKHNNEGDTIWTKRYRHPDYNRESVSHIIEDIIELDNGDIVAMGEISDFINKTEIWYLRVDSEGCFNSSDCDNPIQINTTASHDLLLSNKITLYPNPTSGILNINELRENSPNEKRTFALYDIQGNFIEVLDPKSNQIDISHYTIGVYFLKISENKSTSFIRIVKS